MKRGKTSPSLTNRAKQQNTLAGCSLNRSAPRQSQAEGDVRNSPWSQHGKRSQTHSHISLCWGEITSLTHFDGVRNPRVQAHTNSLPASCFVLLRFSNCSLCFLHNSSIPPLWPSSCTHLCNLVQQFVVFLSFLQGAQIATHSSCQGNGTGYPMECVRRVLFPRGVECTPLLWLPCSSFSSVRPQRSSQSAVSAGHTLLQKLHSCIFGPCCLSLSLASLPITPSPDCSSHAYIHSPLFSPPPSPLSVNTPMLAHTLLARGDAPPPLAASRHTPAQAE